MYAILREVRIKVHGFSITQGLKGNLYNIPVLPIADMVFENGNGVIIAFKGANVEDIRSRIGNQAEAVHFLDYPNEIFAYLMQMICVERTILRLHIFLC